MKTQDLILSFYKMLSQHSADIETKLQEVISNDQSIEWLDLLQTLKYHKLHVLFYKYFKNYIPSSFLCYFSHEYHQSVAWQEVLLEELKILHTAFANNNVPFLLLKGFTIGEKVYGSMYFRPTNDLDILLLDQNDLSRAQSIVESLNYSVFYKKKDYSFGVLPKGYRMKHTGYHETQYSKIIDNDHFIDAELHLNTGSLDDSIIDFFKNSPEKIQIDNMDICIMNKIHFFLYLCANTHENFELNFSVYNNTYIRDVLDVVLYAKTYLNQNDWNDIEKLSKEYNIYHRVCAVIYYALQLNPSDSWVKQLSEKFYFNSENSRFYKNGAYIDWNIGFVDRIFQREERCREYSKMYVEHCFSEKNPNHIPYKAFMPDSPYLTYYNKSLNLPLEWKFETSENSLHICFKNLSASLPVKEYSLAIKFLVDPQNAYKNGGNPMCSFTLRMDSNNHKFTLIDEDEIIVCMEKKEDDVSKFSISLKRIYLHAHKLIAYNMIFCKEVYKDCFEWNGGLFEDYNPKGELGVIQLSE